MKFRKLCACPREREWLIKISKKTQSFTRSLISGKEKHFNNSNNKNQTVNKAASMISEVRTLQKSYVQWSTNMNYTKVDESMVKSKKLNKLREAIPEGAWILELLEKKSFKTTVLKMHKELKEDNGKEKKMM